METTKRQQEREAAGPSPKNGGKTIFCCVARTPQPSPGKRKGCFGRTHRPHTWTAALGCAVRFALQTGNNFCWIFIKIIFQVPPMKKWHGDKAAKIWLPLPGSNRCHYDYNWSHQVKGDHPKQDKILNLRGYFTSLIVQCCRFVVQATGWFHANQVAKLVTVPFETSYSVFKGPSSLF